MNTLRTCASVEAEAVGWLDGADPSSVNVRERPFEMHIEVRVDESILAMTGNSPGSLAMTLDNDIPPGVSVSVESD